MGDNTEGVTITDITSEAQHSDTLQNLVANLGTSLDKRARSSFVNSRRLSERGNEDELEALYRTDWLAGKVIDIIPDDSTREWREFTGDITPDTVDMLVEEEERLGISDVFRVADKWSRLYGTSLVVMNVDDGLEPDKPLKLENVREGSLKHLKVIDRYRFDNADVIPITDPMDADFGLPQYYRFSETSTRIHHSRVIRFDGVELPLKLLRENGYVSDSVLDRLYDALTNFNTVSDGAASMVYETNVDVVKVKNLMNLLSNPEGESLLRKRFTLANMMKSFNNMMLLDTEEEFDKKTNSFAGLNELIKVYGNTLAAASDIPATRLLGTSATGMSATGEGDAKNYYDMLRSKQKAKYGPKLRYLDEIMVRSLGLNPEDDYKYEFRSLFQMTPKEQSEVDLNNANRDNMYVEMGVIHEEAVAKELRQNKTYTNITDEDIEELGELGESNGESFSNSESGEFGSETQTSKGKEEETQGDKSK